MTFKPSARRKVCCYRRSIGLRPDVVLLDLLQTSSLRTIRRVRGICPPCRVVALTGMRHTDSANSVFSAGASDILYRFSAAAELFIAVRTVLSGHLYLSPAFTTLSGDTAGKRTRFTSALSASDKLALRLVARGYPAHRIAQALGLSVGIVRLSIPYRTRQFGRHTKRDVKHHAVAHDLAPILSGNNRSLFVQTRQQLFPVPGDARQRQTAVMIEGTNHHS